MNKKRKKRFDEMTITEKDAEIKRLEKNLKRKKVLYRVSISLTVISVITTVLFIVMLCMGGERLYSIDPILNELVFIFLVIAIISMLLCVNVFVPVYWAKFIRSAHRNVESSLSGDLGVDFIVMCIFIAIPAAIVICATILAPGFYCVKRTVDLKKSTTELTAKIKNYKSVIYPYSGDFEIISAYKM